ncbi:protein lifeguard 4-like isoform X2 [Limulus polyphemus]|nr:protein lifeguard 4-like isoform X2 [Limulus polyphemus]XP_013780188.1 protein lifeguard 4-like isoform X2 [Limulus polyphemus]XP_013780190.1 protein lifeguard 4-like isoform X2 [Limulus polyphemus]XP_022248023.1 protein lifeguard 4-like isoform X2 [Limulus polyphemus]
MTDIKIPINMGEMVSSGKGTSSIVDDFMYGSNVAQAHIYIRMGFLRKVYGILSMQLLLTVVIASITLFTPTVRFYISENDWMLTVAFLLSLVLLVALMVKSRQTPLNYILLTAFTFAEAYTVSVVVTFYDQLAVLQAFVLTMAVTIGLTLYTFQSKRDFSTWGAGLFSMLWILIVAGILQIFVGSTELELLLSVGGAVLFSFFIIYDSHMIMHRLSPEDYILATIDLYLDIINLFLHILRIIGSAKNR